MKKIILSISILLSGIPFSQDYRSADEITQEAYAEFKRQCREYDKQEIVELKNIDDLDTTLFEQEIFKEINRQRQLNRKPIFVQSNNDQSEYTRLWATVQADRNVCGHDPEYYPADAWTEVSAQNFFTLGAYKQRTMQNLAEELAKSIVTQWMNSPGHRRSIMLTDYNVLSVGVGFAVSQKGIMLVYATARVHEN